ncbi:MAG: DNA mismatch endonuclease Vsr [bacterium]
MVDHLSQKKRSWNMSRIKSKDTKPEIIVRSLLHRMGYRFRLHSKNLPGNPDIVLKKYNTVIFCHGCFWHQHKNCKRASIPKSNTEYWEKKLSRNIDRFDKVRNGLEKTGWNVVVVWECEISKQEKLAKRLDSILRKKLKNKNIKI